VTARWVVEAVAPARDVNVKWRPISLFFKNNPDPEGQYYERIHRSHKLLRVMEAVRAGEGDGPVQSVYWDFASRIHHDKNMDFDVAEALSGLGVDTRYAEAFDDEAWDAPVKEWHDDGLSLVGDDVGTPIIALRNAAGERTGIFGPVITRVPTEELSLQLWDGMIACLTVPGFWEMKRTRTERPDIGDRPT
jgi:hypothetical protein